MKERIKKWLGIDGIDGKMGIIDSKLLEFKTLMGEYKEPERDTYGLDWLLSRQFADNSINGRIRTIEKKVDDFLKLKRKIDLLERYLQIELVKTETEKQTYDWANKSKDERYVKCAKTFDQMEREEKRKECCEDDE